MESTAEFPELADLIVVAFDPNLPTEQAIATLTSAESVAEVTPSGGFSIAVSPNDPGRTST